MAQPDPTIVSFLVADQVFRQCDTDGKPGKWCVIGLFDTVYASAFPAYHPSLGLYLKVGNAEGAYRVRLEIADSDGKTVARVGDLQITSTDRIDRGGFGIQLAMLPLPKEGRYFITAYFNDRQATGDCFFHARLLPVTP